MSCICFSALPGDRIPLGPNPFWRVDGAWTPPPSGTPFWTVTVLLDEAPFNAARLIVADGTTFTPPVSMSEAVIGLANTTDWDKEIWAANLCSGRIASVFQAGPNATPRRMRLRQADCREGADTIVFRKPGFFGIWHEVGHLSPSRFWRWFGGTVADFTWTVD